MSSKGSSSPSSSPSPSPSQQEARTEERKEGEKAGEKRESLESSSDASKSSSDNGAAREASSSSETTPNEPSNSNSAEKEEEQAVPSVMNALVQGDWQAIWSPQHGMYYFHNLRTNETTWTNPLVPSDVPATQSAATSTYMSAQEAAAAAGIDPELAYLDPSLPAGPSEPAAFTYTAKFNARTGAFTKADARNPEHVSEYERMRRMNNFYFDMDAWHQEVERRHEEEAESGKKRKKPTKKDLEMFKERKRQKKLAKTAWLRT